MSKKMPTMPENNLSLPGEKELEKAPEAVEELIVPEQVIETEEKKVSNSVELKSPKGGIKVVAMMKGFYGQKRLSEGEHFIVRKFEDLGEWMSCEDPVLEKKRVEHLKLKKEKAKK